MSSSSFRIDYSSRVNKSIERKLIAEGIQTLMHVNSYAYKYIGFGSVWFTDFSLFHKLLHIKKMVSIEHDLVIYERALHNKPYQCIDVEYGDSTEKLQTILSDTDTPSLIWLDYDANIFQCSSYIKDVDTIIKNCKNGTVLLVTMNLINGKIKDLRREFPDDWITKTNELLASTFGMLDFAKIKPKELTDQDKFISVVNSFFWRYG